ncbi:MAG TPA: hypothetical protein VHQ00_13675, partial [Chloroflexota bacterium]|nr:hypothetical protein [Chloroflexota bacterium]
MSPPEKGWLRALALSVWLLALLASTLGFALGIAVYDRGVVYGDPGPALPDLDGPQRAVNTQLEVEPDEESQRRALQLIRAAGFGWIRQQFAWAAVEGGGKGQLVDSNSGRSTWEPHDQIVRLARAEGLRVIARLDLPPAWARPPDSTKTHPPQDVRDYGDYVAAFVERYQGQVDHVQLWNEPNLTNEWGGRPVDPAAYVELLKAGYLGARRASPSVRVLSGMLAPTLEPDRPDARGLDDLLYLDRMYLHGAQPYFDILAGNAYGLHTGPEDRQVGPPYTNFPRLLLTREVMLRHGDGGKAVWVTEFGWNALPEGWTGDPSPWGEVSPEQQAEYIVGAYARARREWPWLGPLALWLFRQPRPDPRDPTAYFGLVDPEWRPRLAYDALRASAPPSGAPTLGPGVHQESAAGLIFGGTWQWTPDPAASLGALRESPISGATLRFRFRGTRLELLAPAGPTSGTAYVKVNGASTLANRLPLTPTGQAFLDLYAPQPTPQRRLVIADGLPDREHEVELAVTGQAAPLSGGPGVGVDAVIVSRARPVLPLLLLVGAWLASLAVALWAGRTALRRAFSVTPGTAVAGAAGTAPGPVSAPRSAAAPPFAPLALAPLPSPTGAAGAALAALAGAVLARIWRLPWRKVLALALAAALPLAP